MFSLCKQIDKLDNLKRVQYLPCQTVNHEQCKLCNAHLVVLPRRLGRKIHGRVSQAAHQFPQHSLSDFGNSKPRINHWCISCTRPRDIVVIVSIHSSEHPQRHAFPANLKERSSVFNSVENVVNSQGADAVEHTFWVLSEKASFINPAYQLEMQSMKNSAKRRTSSISSTLQIAFTHDIQCTPTLLLKERTSQFQNAIVLSKIFQSDTNRESLHETVNVRK